MFNLVLFVAVSVVIAFSSPSYAQVFDSTGQPNTSIGYGDAIYSSTWDRVHGKPSTFPSTWSQISGKPASATRWPHWNEVTGKPGSFPPSSHNHDGRYVRSNTSGSIGGNLDVSGTVSANRIVTADVGGQRWCRASSSGRIQCTYSSALGKSCPSGKVVTGIRSDGNLKCETMSGGGPEPLKWKRVNLFNTCTVGGGISDSCPAAGGSCSTSGETRKCYQPNISHSCGPVDLGGWGFRIQEFVCQ